MVQQHFQLSWSEFSKCISGGICSLQHNGELVDMTLAADGHLVKVHQVVMALASPYIKELITSTHCQQPVIFLNKISYKTLCLLLEYVYTGEVVVTVEKLDEFIEVAKELKIRGLEDVKIQQNTDQTCFSAQLTPQKCNPEVAVQDGSSKEIESSDEVFLENEEYWSQEDTVAECNDSEALDISSAVASEVNDTEMVVKRDTGNTNKNKDIIRNSNVQYTISNYGNLQLILNRYIYFLRSQSKLNKTYRWRCLQYKKTRCPAYAVTKNDVVVQRGNAHTHPFHDKQIFKKIRKGSVFTVLNEALGKEKLFDNK